MKTIAISAVAALALGASFAADETPTTPAEKTAAVEKRTSKTLKVSDVAKDKKLTPEEREAKIAEMKLRQQASPTSDTAPGVFGWPWPAMAVMEDPSPTLGSRVPPSLQHCTLPFLSKQRPSSRLQFPSA